MVAPSRGIPAHDAGPLAAEHLAATQALIALVGQHGQSEGTGFDNARLSRNGKVPTVQIAGLRGGEGVSVVARSLARATAAGLGGVVQHVVFTEAVDAAGSRTVHEDEEDGRGRRHGVTRLTLPANEALRASTQGIEKVLGALSPAVQLVLVETPPLLSAIEGTALSGRVSGTLLVLAADDSTYGDIAAAREAVERAGGAVMGSILNGRRYRVPGLVAKPLGIAFKRNNMVPWQALTLIALTLAALIWYMSREDEPTAAARLADPISAPMGESVNVDEFLTEVRARVLGDGTVAAPDGTAGDDASR